MTLTFMEFLTVRDGKRTFIMIILLIPRFIILMILILLIVR